MAGEPQTGLEEIDRDLRSRRIIKGRPFEVGFECEAKLYRKEQPYEH